MEGGTTDFLFERNGSVAWISDDEQITTGPGPVTDQVPTVFDRAPCQF
jgi:hypothetical protein